MKKIFKYRLMDADYLTVPAGSKILPVAEQRNDIVIYALVDPDVKEKTIYSFLVTGTGHEIEEDLNDYRFLGTVSLLAGSFMFHIFIKPEKCVEGVT
jgi:hypothetical protein